MRAFRTAAAAVLTLMGIAATTGGAENDARPECTFNPRALRSAATLFHELSQRAMNTKVQFGARNWYYRYLRDAVATRKPYDQIVRELITATGNNMSNGAVVFWPRQTQSNGPIQDTYDNLAAFTGERFLGMPF